jgi:hypothetical protein
MAASLDQYDPIFKAAGEEWNVDWRLLKAMAGQESGGNPRAVSGAGAQGLMQIIPETQRYLGVTDAYDPVQSIYGGAKYLAEGLANEREDPRAALLYYHGGPGWRGAYGRESAGYVPAIAARYTALARSEPAPKQYAQADTGRATDATPAPATGGPAVPATPSAASTAPAKDDPDPYTRALSGGSGDKPTKPADAEDDAYAKALGRPSTAEAPPPDAKPQMPDWARGGKPAAPPPDQGSAAPPAGLARLVPTSSPLPNILTAAKEGFEGTPPILTPEARTAVEQSGWLGRNVLNPALSAAGAIIAVPGAVYRGAQQAVVEGLSPVIGEQGARDIASIPDAFAGSPHMLARPTVPEPAPPASPPHPLEAPAPPLTGVNPLSSEAIARGNVRAATAPPGEAASPAPSSTVPDMATAEAQAAARYADQPSAAAPQSVGAAASREGTPPHMLQITPAEERAYRSTAEGQKLLEPQPVGVEDREAYVPGVTPSEAEIRQSATVSREQKMLGQQQSEVGEQNKALAAANNEARQRYFERIAGSDVTLTNAKATRAAQAEQDLAATWANKTDANAQPVVDAADAIKASPDGRRPLVRSAVDSVTKELLDKDGNLITDPEQLYGVRKHLDDLMSKEASADDPKSVRAQASLQKLKQTLDDVIEAAAPGFRQYLKNFSDASRLIDTMEVLQKHEAKLYDALNRMQLSRVQSMMKQIVDSRSAPGSNAYKSIPDETMAQLWRLRDDLRRARSADDLAATKGSDTSQNIADVAKGYAKAAGAAAVHGAANYLAPVSGSFVVEGARNVLRPISAARTARRQTQRGLEMLNPSPGKFPLRNPLTPP